MAANQGAGRGGAAVVVNPAPIPTGDPTQIPGVLGQEQPELPKISVQNCIERAKAYIKYDQNLESIERYLRDVLKCDAREVPEPSAEAAGTFLGIGNAQDFVALSVSSGPPISVPSPEDRVAACIARAKAYSEKVHDLEKIEIFLRQKLGCSLREVLEDSDTLRGTFLGIGESGKIVIVYVSKGPPPPPRPLPDLWERIDDWLTAVIGKSPTIAVILLLAGGAGLVGTTRWLKRRLAPAAPSEPIALELERFGPAEAPAVSVDESASLTFSVEITRQPLRPPSIEESPP